MKLNSSLATLTCVLVILLCLGGAMPRYAAASAFSFEQFIVGVAASGEGFDSEGEFVSTSPFAADLFASLNGGTSSVNSTFNITWGDSSLHYSSTTNQEVKDINSHSITVVSGPSLIMNTTEDLYFSFHGHYTYDVPASSFMTTFKMNLTNLSGPGFLGELHQGGPAINQPAAGTFNIDVDQFLVPAGTRLKLSYAMETLTFGGTTNVVGTGSGAVDFWFETVPEPSTLWLCGIGLLLVRRRR